MSKCVLTNFYIGKKQLTKNGLSFSNEKGRNYLFNITIKKYKYIK